MSRHNEKELSAIAQIDICSKADLRSNEWMSTCLKEALAWEQVLSIKVLNADVGGLIINRTGKGVLIPYSESASVDSDLASQSLDVCCLENSEVLR